MNNKSIFIKTFEITLIYLGGMLVGITSGGASGSPVVGLILGGFLATLIVVTNY